MEKNQVFWEKITSQYNNNQLFCCVEHSTKSLETKWGVIKYDVTKFCYNYQAMAIFNKSYESFENTLQKVLKLFKAKHPKQGLFIFIHCWLILNMFLNGQKLKKKIGFD
jgi:hypothetical protein